jgi:hypothetical protein
MWNGRFAGPVPVDATEGSGDADRTGDIEALRQRRESCSDRHRSPTGASTGGATQIPGVVGPPKEGIIGLSVPGIGRHVGLAEQDPTGGQEPPRKPRVLHRNDLGACGKARRGAQSGHLDTVLDRQRQAVERPKRLAPAMSGLGLGCAPARLLVIGDHNRVELLIVARDTRQVELD